MTTNPNDPANPISAEIIEKKELGHFNNPHDLKPFGLTKREQFAMAAMQGIRSNPIYEFKTAYYVAKMSIELADALINALNETK